MKLLKLITPSDEELLRSVHVASPCHESWESMPGGDTVRSCDRCQQKVYNLSEMTATEAAAFVRESQGRHCIRFYRRVDGTLLTRDCPVGAHAKRRKRVKAVAALSGATAAAVGVALHRSEPAVVQGSPMPVYAAPQGNPTPEPTVPEDKPEPLNVPPDGRWVAGGPMLIDPPTRGTSPSHRP